ERVVVDHELVGEPGFGQGVVCCAHLGRKVQAREESGQHVHAGAQQVRLDLGLTEQLADEPDDPVQADLLRIGAATTGCRQHLAGVVEKHKLSFGIAAIDCSKETRHIKPSNSSCKICTLCCALRSTRHQRRLNERIASGMSQSLDRALRALTAIAEGKTTLNELAETLDVHRTTALRLLRTLERHRFVFRPDPNHYQLGSGLFALSTTALASRDIRQVAHPYLVKLSQRHGHTVHLAAYES